MPVVDFDFVAPAALIAEAGATTWADVATADLVTSDQLADYIRTAKTDPRLALALAGARDAVNDALARAWKPIPVHTYTQLVLDTGLELHRRPDHNSVPSQYVDTSTGTPVRAAKDPLTTSRPIIARYVTPF